MRATSCMRSHTRRRSGAPQSGEPGTHNSESLVTTRKPVVMDSGLRPSAGPGMTAPDCWRVASSMANDVI
jgi:hypothetical protein